MPDSVSKELPLIALRGISKSFGSLQANREISLDIRQGEIHGIVGENGAGKSTLMNILYGRLRPDSGRIILEGRETVFNRPRDAMRAGIGMAHQQPLIFPQMTAFENIVVGFEPKALGFSGEPEAKENLMEICGRFGFDLPLDSLAEDLSFASLQQIELLRILHRRSTTLLLDEPTSLLAPFEADRLMEILRALQRTGHTIVFISHRLNEVLSISNTVSVLRRGRLIGVYDAASTTAETLSGLIIGEEDPGSVRPDSSGQGAPPWSPRHHSSEIHLEVSDVSVGHSGNEAGLSDFSIQVFKGEILGIGGVAGNGQRTLARLLAGMVPALKGAIKLEGLDVTRSIYENAGRSGISWLPADPPEEALLPSRSVWENLLLGRQRETEFQTFGLLRKKAVVQYAREQVRINEIACRDPEDLLSSLSGGNRQKTALARSLSLPGARLIVLEQPGRGLDIRAQMRLRERVRELNAAGLTFLVFSHHLEELLALSDRIGILYRGRLMGTAKREEASREMLGRWMLGLGETG